MIKYPVRAARALGYLKSPFNDLEIYVEDTASQNTYLRVFRKILGGGVRLRSIVQLGGRAAVIEACRRDQAHDGRKRLYIIDGDFDIIDGRRKPRLRNLYRLRAYCFENILIHERAIVECCTVSDPTVDEATAIADMNFNEWSNKIASHFAGLFTLYAASHRLNAGVKTVSYPVARLCNNTPRGREICPKEVRKRMIGVCRELRLGHGRDAVSKELSRLRRRAPKSRKRLFAAISGKDYILPLVHSRLQKKYKYKGSEAQLGADLSRDFDSSIEPGLSRALRLAARA